VTANDFHKAIRKLHRENTQTGFQLTLDNLAQQTGVDKTTLFQHLIVLKTLNLVQLHDEEKGIFSLTESGLLANLA